MKDVTIVVMRFILSIALAILGMVILGVDLNVMPWWRGFFGIVAIYYAVLIMEHAVDDDIDTEDI